MKAALGLAITVAILAQVYCASITIVATTVQTTTELQRCVAKTLPTCSQRLGCSCHSNAECNINGLLANGAGNCDADTLVCSNMHDVNSVTTEGGVCRIQRHHSGLNI